MKIKSASYYLDMIKAVQNIHSDYAVGKLLNIPSDKIAKMRNGKVSLDTIIAIDIAKYAEVDVVQVIFNAKAFKAHKMGNEIGAARWLELVEAT